MISSDAAMAAACATPLVVLTKTGLEVTDDDSDDEICFLLRRMRNDGLEKLGEHLKMEIEVGEF